MRNTDLICPAGAVLTVVLVCLPVASATASNGSEMAKDAEAILEATSARYMELQSLHQKCTWRYAPVEGEELPNHHFVEFTQTSELYFKRPNRMYIVDDNFELFSDGTTMWIVDRARGVYTIGPPPEQLANVSQLIDAGASPVLGDSNLLAMSMLFPDQSSSDCAPASSAEQIHLEVTEAEHDGIPGLLISDQSAGDHEPATNYWISALTGLIHRWELIAKTTYHGDSEDLSDDVTGLTLTVIE